MKDSLLIQRTENHESLIDYLLLADESEDVVRSYYDQGELYELIYNHATVGACLMTFPENDVAEIKNIALSEETRGQGFGKRTIEWLVDHYKGRGYKQLIVGTSNSSLENIAFYQKAGFRFSSIERDFFLSYPETFFEHGIQGRDMIMFERTLKP